jgi:hypothetical protein
MRHLLRKRPSPSMVVALIALFVSLGGVSYGVATGSIDSRELKNNTVRSGDLRNNDVRGKDLRNNGVTGADVLAGSSDNAETASRLAGLSPGSINAAGETENSMACDVAVLTGTDCATALLQQPSASNVLVLATGTFWGSATATGRCNLRLADPFASSAQTEIGQQLATHTSSDSGAGFSMVHVFTDVPAGQRTFQLHCVEESGNLQVSFARVVAVRLSG